MNSRFFLIIVLLSNLTLASSQCLGFYKTSRCAVKNAADFKQYGQARSAAVEIGKKYKYATVLYGKKDYIISICSEIGFKSLRYKIYDKTNNVLIYDSQEDENEEAVAFSVEKTSNVEIEVEIDKENVKDDDKFRVCVGIQILWRKIPNLGFEK